MGDITGLQETAKMFRGNFSPTEKMELIPFIHSNGREKKVGGVPRW